MSCHVLATNYIRNLNDQFEPCDWLSGESNSPVRLSYEAMAAGGFAGGGLLIVTVDGGLKFEPQDAGGWAHALLREPDNAGNAGPLCLCCDNKSCHSV